MLRPIAILTLVATMSLAAVEGDSRPRFSYAQVAAAGLEAEVTWKEVGIWREGTVHNVVTAEASATYVCLEAGQARVADRQNVDDFLSVEGDFASTKGGFASGSLTLKPPGPGMFSCAPGERLQLVCARYTQLSCKDDTYAISSELRRTVVSFEPGYGQFCSLDLR